MLAVTDPRRSAEPDIQRTVHSRSALLSGNGGVMHRSRPFVLVIVGVVAACSKRNPADGNDILSQDRTLVARLETSKDARRASVPDACGAIRIAAAPSAADQQQAEALTQQAGVAEMHGDIQDARSLLQRAAALDATNKSAAYHLGRTSEALGDRGTAVAAYCRYLALAPTAAESVEARQRVAGLSRAMPHTTRSTRDSLVARSNVVAAASPRRPVRARPSVGSRVVASAPVQRPAPRTPERITEPTPVTTNGDVVAAPPSPTSAPDPSPAPSRTQRRGSIGAQSTIIGVAAGAILGAATGRSVKSTVIGAAAGGVLGTVVGATTRPPGRATRS
jgi:hypothetical protein